MNSWIKKYAGPLSLLAGIVIAAWMYFGNPFGVDAKAKLVLAIASLMISWWVLDAMPLAVVALVPLVLFPLLNINTIKDTSKAYSDSVIYLFMGGFFLGLAIEKWNLHKRIALNIIKITGTNGNNIVLGFILATGMLSMWLSNTATTMMMFPIAASVIHVVNNHGSTTGNINNFSLTLMLSVAYASNFGGIATIIGTPPNVAYMSHLKEEYNQTVSFSKWLLVCMPLSILLLLSLYLVMVKWLYPNHIKNSNEGRFFIQSELQKIGKLSGQEKRVLVIFCSTAFLWIFKDLINGLQKLVQLDDTIIALIGAISLFIVPSGANKEKPEGRLLDWEDTSKMAWGILLLFGGGIALARALEEARLIENLGKYIAAYATGNTLLLIF